MSAFADVSQGSVANLRKMLLQADGIDWREGKLAYGRYREVLTSVALRYDIPLERAVAGFVALSPNSDYLGNLRSLVSVLEGIRDGVNVDQITISTYNHCRDRAYEYLTGITDFWETTKGPKIRSFFRNIMDPDDPEWVTIDGHMVAAWLDKQLVMKDALLRGPQAYQTVAAGVRQLARETGLVTNQVQAIIWFTRKRVLKIRYSSEMDLFAHADGDVWQTLVPIDGIRPYPRSKA